MSLIRADGVNFSYFGSLEPVFTNLNFTIDSSWRTGLIGANGSGKTTLFKILCGEEKCGSKIISNVRFVRFPFDADPYESVGDVAARCGEAWRLARELYLCWGWVRRFVTARSARFRAGSGQRSCWRCSSVRTAFR